MKKIVVSFVSLMCVFVFVFTFAGCNLFGLIDHKDELIGVLTEQEIGDEYPGSHLLTDENGDIYSLNSTVLNLSSQQYLGNKINANVEYDDENEVYKVSGISVLEVLEKESGKANWMTYMNQTLGLKLKYYDNWELSEYNNIVDFIAPLQGETETTTETVSGTAAETAAESPVLPDYVSFTKHNKEEGVSFTDYVNKIMAENKNADKLQVSDAKVGVNQQSATKYSITGSTEVHFFLERDPYVYEVAFVPEENFNNNNEKTFYEMLLEFQFVPFDEEALAELDKAQAEEAIVAAGGVVEKEEEEEEAAEAATVEPEEAKEPGGVVEPEVVEEAVEEAVEPEDEEEAAEAATKATAEFESLPYHFSAKYPASWYYAGAKGSEDGVLHKYAFSNESVTDENEFASLKVLSGDLPAGTAVTMANGKAVKKFVGDDVYFYVKVSDRVYSVQGAKSMEDVLMQIAASIKLVEAQE
ncbi:MAG: hypothetical protein WC604_00205 [Candidatus Gracilibacteria bacterium]